MLASGAPSTLHALDCPIPGRLRHEVLNETLPNLIGWRPRCQNRSSIALLAGCGSYVAQQRRIKRAMARRRAGSVDGSNWSIVDIADVPESNGCVGVVDPVRLWPDQETGETVLSALISERGQFVAARVDEGPAVLLLQHQGVEGQVESKRVPILQEGRS
mmetsp:Transcript_35280/g.64539  ORF Transcript_35280/g.64539 Transcript_35280/m.64539 type:complete len:160 (-) Transcript_35280:408-887(-)